MLVGGQVFLERYEIIRKIGEGSTSFLFEARHTYLDRLVALKLLKRDLPPDSLLREARIAALLRHPAFVQIFDGGRSGNEQCEFLVMELVAGETVRELIDSGVLSPVRALRIAIDAAEAMRSAHAMGIVHRDLSPRNIAVTVAGEVKILDMGCACFAGERDREPAVFGTWGYIAPEHVEHGANDARIDQYSLACVAYEMVTGRHPYIARGNSMPPKPELLRLARRSTSPPPVLGMPIEFEQTIARAMAGNPDRRYVDAAEFADALRACLPEIESRTPGLRSSGVQPKARRISDRRR